MTLQKLVTRTDEAGRIVKDARGVPEMVILDMGPEETEAFEAERAARRGEQPPEEPE